MACIHEVAAGKRIFQKIHFACFLKINSGAGRAPNELRLPTCTPGDLLQRIGAFSSRCSTTCDLVRPILAERVSRARYRCWEILKTVRGFLRGAVFLLSGLVLMFFRG
jgi:hypothetical protein